MRERDTGVAQKRYTAPPNQAGLRLRSVMGYHSGGTYFPFILSLSALVKSLYDRLRACWPA